MCTKANDAKKRKATMSRVCMNTRRIARDETQPETGLKQGLNPKAFISIKGIKLGINNELFVVGGM